MKLMLIMVACTMPLAGCYTYATLTADMPLPSAKDELSFRLLDGTHIISVEYSRIDSGYTVVGKVIDRDNKHSKEFSGIVHDGQIEEIVTCTFSPARTALGVLSGIVVMTAVLGFGVHEAFQ